MGNLPISSVNIIFILELLTSINFAVDPKEFQTKENINQLRALVKPMIYPNNSIVHQHIQDDLYLQRWLDRSNSNVGQAKQQILNHLAWRKTERMDTIHLEDWSRFKEDYPQYLTSTDKMGRPLAELWLSDWDVRRATLSGEIRKVVRWNSYLSEMGQRALYEIRRKTRNKNITGIVELIDMEGFNAWKHSCVLCMPFFVDLGRVSSEQYPSLWERNYMVNVGPVFRSFLYMMNSNLHYPYMQALKLFSGRDEWMPVLEKEIDRNQRSRKFGGNIIRDYR